jgi:hypothetical protein
VRVCEVDGCDRPHNARGMCKGHYKKWWLSNAVRKCGVDGCDRAHEARDMCQTHYRKWQISMGLVRTSCGVDGCDGPLLARGMCRSHYSTWWRQIQMDDRKACIVDGCETLADPGRRLCAKHEGRLRRTGTTDPQPPCPPKFCTVSGCTNRARSRGLCQMHYNGWYKQPKPGDKACTVAGCEGRQFVEGLCSKHDQRRRRLGDPSFHISCPVCDHPDAERIDELARETIGRRPAGAAPRMTRSAIAAKFRGFSASSLSNHVTNHLDNEEYYATRAKRQIERLAIVRGRFQ